MSALRAKCPDCGTLTAVAMGPEYECHVCGRQFAAGMIRIPTAFGAGGDAMREAARIPLPYPEVATVEEETLEAQTLHVASSLPEKPLVLGGCCCSHIGAIEGLANRHGRISVVWLDAHGDLNTPESSPTGNVWGMPLRMAIDSGAVAAGDVCLVGARALDPPEVEFIEQAGVRLDEDGIGEAVDGTAGVYVALDCDSLDEADFTPFMPEPDGLRVADVERMFRKLADGETPIVGVGLSGMTADPRNLPQLTRLLTALGV